MARKVRIEYPGAVYHVMSGGDHQEASYREDADRELSLECLAEACEKTGWRIHACVLMGDHCGKPGCAPQAAGVAAGGPGAGESGIRRR